MYAGDDAAVPASALRAWVYDGDVGPVDTYVAPLYSGVEAAYDGVYAGENDAMTGAVGFARVR